MSEAERLKRLNYKKNRKKSANQMSTIGCAADFIQKILPHRQLPKQSAN